MGVADDGPISRKRLQALGAQLANDRKLEILSYAAGREQFSVAELREALELPHTTAHEYCRDLKEAGLLQRVRGKPAAYAPVDFDIHLSIDEIASAVEMGNQTLKYAHDRYGEDIVDQVLDVWERVERGDLTYREASAHLGMDHADFLRVAAELELFER